MLGAILLSVHNLHFLLDLMRRAREAVLADAYEEFFEQWMESPAAAGLLSRTAMRRSEPAALGRLAVEQVPRLSPRRAVGPNGHATRPRLAQSVGRSR